MRGHACWNEHYTAWHSHWYQGRGLGRGRRAGNCRADTLRNRRGSVRVGGAQRRRPTAWRIACITTARPWRSRCCICGQHWPFYNALRLSRVWLGTSAIVTLGAVLLVATLWGVCLRCRLRRFGRRRCRCICGKRCSRCRGGIGSYWCWADLRARSWRRRCVLLRERSCCLWLPGAAALCGRSVGIGGWHETWGISGRNRRGAGGWCGLAGGAGLGTSGAARPQERLPCGIAEQRAVRKIHGNAVDACIGHEQRAATQCGVLRRRSKGQGGR